MKPGNLLIQGAKSGVRRKMRVRITTRSESSERLFLQKNNFLQKEPKKLGGVHSG